MICVSVTLAFLAKGFLWFILMSFFDTLGSATQKQASFIGLASGMNIKAEELY